LWRSSDVCLEGLGKTTNIVTQGSWPPDLSSRSSRAGHSTAAIGLFLLKCIYTPNCMFNWLNFVEKAMQINVIQYIWAYILILIHYF
jgi:hypothetical protein